MHKIQHIVSYITDSYGFEVVPCSIPKNKYQYMKRNFYIFIRKRSENLFTFFSKISPVEFLKDRPHHDIFLSREINDSIIEISMSPIPLEATIYTTGISYNFKVDHNSNYKVFVHDGSEYIYGYPFIINGFTLTKDIDDYFLNFTILKPLVRDRKLNSLL